MVFRGLPVTYRLGSSKSTVNRTADKCSFCKGDDRTKSNKSCQRVTSCKLKMSYGECVEAKALSTTEMHRCHWDSLWQR